MKLSSVEIVGYRSFSKKVVLNLDPTVTIVIGANDHGKTNLLEALTHLNESTKFEEERDLNWDQAGAPEEFPYLKFTFRLDETDRTEILRLAQEKLSESAAKVVASANSVPAADSQLTAVAPPETLLTRATVPNTIFASKKGVSGSLSFLKLPGLPELTEGDTDPIYVQAVLQKLVALKVANVDLNAFSAISTESSKNADALIRILSDGAVRPNLAILVDGDDGGKNRLKSLQGIMKSKEIRSKQLLDETTIEDFLPLAGELYVRAVADYVMKVKESQGTPIANADNFRQEFRTSFREAFEEGKVTKGVAAWAASAGQKLGGLEGAPSKLGIAREYISLLEESEPEKFTPQSLQRPLKLLEWIREILPIPELRESEKAILGEE